MSHQAGIPIIDDLAAGSILDWDVMARAVARHEPMWSPGERHGYHGASFGWLVGGLTMDGPRTAGARQVAAES